MSGLTDYGKRLALDAVCPEGTNRYVTLFSTAPNEDGEGYVEFPLGGWFTRVIVSAWLFEEQGSGTLSKVNAANIQFGQNTSGAQVTAVAVGIFDAASDGNLIAWAPTRDATGATEIEVDIPDGGIPLIGLEQLKVQLTSTGDTVASAVVTTEDSVHTSDATPTVLRIAAALTDGYAYHFEAFVWAKETGGTKHFKRRLWASYYRDGTSGLWTLDHADTLGAGTYVGFTTASADFVLTGNRVDLKVTGEAGTEIDWQCDLKVRRETA